MPLSVSSEAKEPMARADARGKAKEEDADVDKDVLVVVAGVHVDKVPRAGEKANPHFPTDAR